MQTILNKSKIEYIFYHLNFSINIDDTLKDKIVFIKSVEEIKKYNKHIIFPLVEEPLSLENLVWKKNIPILFPYFKNNETYFFKDNNIVFSDDLFKSSFYLLSGIQEYQNEKTDDMDRFPFKESIQYKLDIVNKPVVNYYFKFIEEGIKDFCSKYGLSFTKHSFFDNFGFMLTHDVDRIEYYRLYRIKLLLKLLFGIKKSDYNKLYLFKNLLKAIYKWPVPLDHNDPYWNFEWLRKIEKEYGLVSVFYFLHKNQKHVDSYYEFTDKNVRNLIKYLEKENCEIGLHGTVESVLNHSIMIENKQELQKISKNEIHGIRQHRLTYDNPKTLHNQLQAGIQYDTTLGFAEHEGFRNSYCLPYKIYDHVNDKMSDIWEFPLIVMDCTLFDYRNLTYNEAYTSINNLLDEIIKFNGLFVLLWHNTYFDEEKHPGIAKFYSNLLKNIVDKKPSNVLGKELLSKLEMYITI